MILSVASSFENCGGDFKPVLFSFLTSFLGFSGGSVARRSLLPVKESQVSIPSSSGRCPEEEEMATTVISFQENPMDRGA